MSNDKTDISSKQPYKECNMSLKEEALLLQKRSEHWNGKASDDTGGQIKMQKHSIFIISVFILTSPPHYREFYLYWADFIITYQLIYRISSNFALILFINPIKADLFNKCDKNICAVLCACRQAA